MGHQRVVSRVLGTLALAATITVSGLGSAVAAPSNGSGTSAVQRVTAAARHSLAAQHRTGTRTTLRLGDADPADYYLDLQPGCAKGKGKASTSAVVASATKVTLDYSLTGTGNLHKTGKVKVKKNRVTTLKLPKVHKGSYRLVLKQHGHSAVVADQAFDVLPCVVVKASCHAVTFTNPTGNPVASVSYGRSFDERFWVDVAGGTSTRVRVDVKKIRYTAYAAADDKDAVSSVGAGKITVKQKCKHGPAAPGQLAVQTSANVGCAGSAAGEVELFWSAQPSLTHPGWQVVDAAGKTVAKGSLSSGGSRTVSLPAGAYRYRSYANGSATPFEDLAFRVLDCVVVTPGCRALEVSNPNTVDVVVLATGFDDSDDADPSEPTQTTVAAGQSVSLPVVGDTAILTAFPKDEDGSELFFGFASPLPGDGEDYAIPQDC